MVRPTPRRAHDPEVMGGRPCIRGMRVTVGDPGANGPSVVHVRALDLVPDAIGDDVVRLLGDHADALAAGPIVTLDETRTRVRVLPIHRSGRVGG